MPNLYLIGGPNGAGKTTIATKMLPDYLGCYEFVNADNIAAGLSPFRPESVALQAGRFTKMNDQQSTKSQNGKTSAQQAESKDEMTRRMLEGARVAVAAVKKGKAAI
jgi:predicted ABC-type ATPase